MVVLGGSKVSDKLGVIDNLLGKADKLLIGGGMVFTFLKAQGHEVGKSLLEEDQVDTCRDYLAAGGGQRRPAAAAHRRRRGRRVRRRRRAERGAGRHDPRRTRSAWTSVRRRAEAFAAALARRQDGVLERPDGRLRVRGLLRRHPGRRPGADGDRRPVGRRRRRLRRGGAPARLRRGRRSGTSPPAAAPASSTSRARTSPASTCSEPDLNPRPTRLPTERRS